VESGIKGLLEKIKTLDVKKHLKLLDKILSFIVKLYYVILLIILISLVYFIVTSTENIYKALLSIVIIILLVMLRFTRKYMKRIMAEINTVRDMKEDEKLKKELIFYITFQLFMSLILTNISLFVFF
jgi:ABC-type methionine transport system permease subunit